MDQVEPLPGVLTVDEVAEAAGMARACVYGGLEAKEIPGVRVGKRWILSRQRIQEHFGISDQDVRRAVQTVAAKRAAAKVGEAVSVALTATLNGAAS